MHQSPKISVLIRTTWRDSLAQTLQSVAEQNYSNIEIVLVAPQEGRNTLSDLVPKSSRVILTQHLMPRAQAANLALDGATGEYCIFLDDDDWWDKAHLSGLMKAVLEQSALHVQSRIETGTDHPDQKASWTPKTSIAAHSLTQLVSQSGATPKELMFNDCPNVIGQAFEPVQLLSGNCLPIHSVLFPRSLVFEHGCRFDEQMDLYEDWDFWLQVAQVAQFICVPEVTAFYWIHPSSGVHELEAFDNLPAQFIYLKWYPLVAGKMRAQLMKNAALFPPTKAQLLVSEKNALAAHEKLSVLSGQVNE